MRFKSVLIRSMALLALVACLSGCPAALKVTPTALDFGTTGVAQKFTILNQGSGVLQWTISEVTWSAADKTWKQEDVPWLSIDEGSAAGNTSQETTWVGLHVDRTGLAPGTYQAGVQVTANAKTKTVSLSMTVASVAAAEGEGEGEGEGETPGTTLTVTPNPLRLKSRGDTGNLTVLNGSNGDIQWYTEFRANVAGVDTTQTTLLVAQPNTATTDAATTDGATSTAVTVKVEDPFNFNYQTDPLNYVLSFKRTDNQAVLAQVSVSIDFGIPPEIMTKPEGTLDFGRENYQISFQVANVGEVNSLLNFGFFVTKLVNAADSVYVPFVPDPNDLVVAITPESGSRNVLSEKDHTDWETNWLHARTVTATINRDAIKQDLEFRQIWVAAVSDDTDTNGNHLIDLSAEPKELDIRAEAAPFLEGAINRSRPPSMMRFVFLMRDKFGVGLNGLDSFVREQVSFKVYEDEKELDLNETNMFVTAPDNLRANIVVMLDLTGSMYNAGVDDPTTPLQPGQAIQQMKEASKQFIMDLPASWRVAVMEYHTLRQAKRLVHPFSLDRKSLSAAIDAFSIPAEEHGGSEIIDALADATAKLAGEDAQNTLPFDDADLRMIVFLSDGRDTSSVTQLSALSTTAKDARVRFYPVGYTGSTASPVNTELLLTLASPSGGHTYYAPKIDKLTRLLDTDNSLTIEGIASNEATSTITFRIRNNGSDPLSWNVQQADDWLAVTPNSGAVAALQSGANVSHLISIAVNAGGLGLGAHDGKILINSNGGAATLNVTAEIKTLGGTPLISMISQTQDMGVIARELSGQVVLTYLSLFQNNTHKYRLESLFPASQGVRTSASFEKDGVFFPGDPIAGQISLLTDGIQDGKAIVRARLEYVPRGISSFRVRFFVRVPNDPADELALQQQLAQDSVVKIATGGLLPGFRLIKEGNGVFTAFSEGGAPLDYGSFGDLLTLELNMPSADPNFQFQVGFRVDNTLYYHPATDTSPSTTKYFLYPGGVANPAGDDPDAQRGMLTVQANRFDLTGAASSPIAFVTTVVDPDGVDKAWDRDKDGVSDFDDLYPDIATRH